MKTRDKAGLDTGENLNKIESEVERLKHENEELKAKVKFYEEQFRLSQAKKYGPSSDKVQKRKLRGVKASPLRKGTGFHPNFVEIC